MPGSGQKAVKVAGLAKRLAATQGGLGVPRESVDRTGRIIIIIPKVLGGLSIGYRLGGPRV
jgi:hypothetical protein